MSLFQYFFISIFVFNSLFLFFSAIFYQKIDTREEIQYAYQDDITDNVYSHRVKVTSYYTPVQNQKSYINGSYTDEYNMNCQGDCRVTASGFYLKNSDKYQVMACPPSIPLGTHILIKFPKNHKFKEIEGVCQDRGGMINDNKIDVWTGIGQPNSHVDVNSIYSVTTRKHEYATVLLLNK